MNTRYYIGLLVLGLCLSSSVPVVATSTSTYDLTVAGSVDTPSRTISFDGGTHEVSAVAKATPGKTLRVSVSAPSDADYRVNLYNGDRQVTAQQPATGNANLQFDLTGYESGSYMLLLYKDGDYKDAYPVVVQGYETMVNTPSQANTDSELNVTVTAEKTAQVEDPSTVRVVLANDEQTVRATATNDGSQKYHATISLSDFQPGEARVYAVVQGSEDAFKDGRKELLGISDPSTLTIAEPTTQPTTDSPDPSTTTDPTDPGTSTTVTTSATPTTTTTNATTETTSQSPTTTTAVTTNSSTSSTVPQSPESTTTTDSTTDSAIITPAQSTMSPTTTTTTPETSGQGVPGFGLGVSLVALCSFLVLLLRQ